MIFDKIEKIKNSTIHHGKQNDRIYVLKLDTDDYPEIIEKLEKLAIEKEYAKIIIKARSWMKKGLINRGYKERAIIPGFYRNNIDLHFFTKFLKGKASIPKAEKEKIKENLALAQLKNKDIKSVQIDKTYKVKKLTEKNLEQLTELYKKTFSNYPFPIFKKSYLKKTMNENVLYFGIFEGQKLIAAASAETDPENHSAEMTDFATDPDYRGEGLALFLLVVMEKELKKQNFHILYTIARAISPAINIIFSKLKYTYSGTLLKNTAISNDLENMNIWHKNI